MTNSDPKGQYYRQDRSAMLRFVPLHAKSVLEVGCANGSFGEAIKSRQECLYVGIEPHESSAEEAATKLDKVYNSFFEDARFSDGTQFDCIVFNDVLEHLPDPWVALQNCLTLLSPNGIVVSSVPNFLYWPVQREIVINRDWIHTDWGVLDRTHRWFFTRKSLKRMFESSGFEIVRMEGMKKCKSRAFGLMNSILMRKLEDYKYMQYAVVAKRLA
jgi:2-polyprenyl-3-methyl-5-hydroxy-6-metoxy-1,4-benzoquinol methylase